tara:strand:+ start:639 stop:1475 length:837 start_codon:yes stop_codon:yes gene_type:complete
MADSLNIQLKKFDMKSIKDDKVVVLIGKRDTGKSFLVKDLLYYHQDIPIGTVVSGTESANSFYSEIVPSLFIHDEFTAELINNVVRRQKLIVNKTKEDIARKGSTKIDPRAFIILDDCLYDKSWIKDVNVRTLFMNGRHYNIMFIITMQYALGIPPNLRTNVDFVFILRENYVSNRKRLYEHYAGMFPTFEMFCQVMDQCTENYECLVINNNAKSNKLEDQVFWYKAEPHNSFQIGSQKFWKHHSNNFNNRYNSVEEPVQKHGKKKKQFINVKKLDAY